MSAHETIFVSFSNCNLDFSCKSIIIRWKWHISSK